MVRKLETTCHNKLLVDMDCMEELQREIVYVQTLFRECFNDCYQHELVGYRSFYELLISKCEKEQQRFSSRYPDLVKVILQKFRDWCKTKCRYHYMQLMLSNLSRTTAFPALVARVLHIFYGDTYRYLLLAEDDLAYRLGYDDETLLKHVQVDVLFDMRITTN